MAKYLLDTNICIFLLRGKKGIDIKIDKVGQNNCFISEITVAELQYGIECSEQNRDRNRKIVEGFIEDIQILPVSNVISIYAKEKALLRKQGKLIDDLDLFIGATAIANDMILVTGNEKHLNRLSNIKIENWINR